MNRRGKREEVRDKEISRNAALPTKNIADPRGSAIVVLCSLVSRAQGVASRNLRFQISDFRKRLTTLSTPYSVLVTQRGGIEDLKSQILKLQIPSTSVKGERDDGQ